LLTASQDELRGQHSNANIRNSKSLDDHELQQLYLASEQKRLVCAHSIGAESLNTPIKSGETCVQIAERGYATFTTVPKHTDGRNVEFFRFSNTVYICTHILLLSHPSERSKAARNKEKRKIVVENYGAFRRFSSSSFSVLIAHSTSTSAAKQLSARPSELPAATAAREPIAGLLGVERTFLRGGEPSLRRRSIRRASMRSSALPAGEGGADPRRQTQAWRSRWAGKRGRAPRRPRPRTGRRSTARRTARCTAPCTPP
jgi:hypothetical protein